MNLNSNQQEYIVKVIKDTNNNVSKYIVKIKQGNNDTNYYLYNSSL